MMAYNIQNQGHRVPAMKVRKDGVAMLPKLAAILSSVFADFVGLAMGDFRIKNLFYLG